jgi:RNA polymerase sigma factor (sigma-70 family)
MGTSSRSESGVPTDADARFADLFAVERDGMVRLASLLVDSVAIAEEVVQEAFISVREKWEGVDRPGAYLRTSVVNGCSAVLRRRAIEDRFQTVRSAQPEIVDLPIHLFELRAALDCLTGRQRFVIVLRYFADASDHEIAQLMEVRSATVRSLRRRAFSILRKELS